MEKMIVSSLSNLMGEEEEIYHIGVSSVIHDDQSLEFQVRGLSNREKDNKCI